MANLYDIQRGITDCVDEETGEVIDFEKLSALTMELSEKIENIALWIKNLEADAEAFKREEEAFEERKKAAANKAESLRRYLDTALNGQKFATERVSVSFRNSKAVQIAENTELPAEYIKTKVEKLPDKKKIGDALKNGIAVPGCALVTNRNMQIK